MTRYNSNYGSHDQLQDLRRANMVALREVDQLKLEVQRLTDELYLAHEALKREFVHKGIIETVNPDAEKWRNIAGNLYDEMRVRGAECLYRHDDATKDCVKDFELADEMVNP